MSRKVERTPDLGDLSQDDLKYLATRGQLTLEECHAYINDYSGTGAIEFGDAGLSKADATPAPSQSNATGNGGGDDDEPLKDEDDDSEVPEESDYADYTNDDLRKELDEREIGYPSKAKKAELVALLEADDEE